MIADEYALTHRCIFGDRPQFDRPHFSGGQPQTFKKPQRIEPQGNGNVGPELCPYCQQEGHWKRECSALTIRGKAEQVKSEGLVATVCRPVGSAMDFLAPFDMQIQTVAPPEVYSSYRTFISGGFVRFGEGDKEIPVTIQRDSGSMHTFVRKAILLFA